MDSISTENHLKNKYYQNSGEKILVLVGGDGDSKEKFNPLVKQLEKVLPKYDFLTFSFTGIEEGKYCSPHQQTKDLFEILEGVIARYPAKRIDIMCTSAGAFSTVYALSKFPNISNIRIVIFVDPADYYLSMGDSQEPVFSWKGFEKYNPDGDTVVGLIKDIDSEVKVQTENR